ncbi:MAG: branched-chain amino acid ABC transporter substrate-binding protein [Granulosicoccaceae bacterium]
MKLVKYTTLLVASMIATITPHHASADFVVGIAGPLTGNVALNGEQQDLGAQRAVLDLNEAGGLLGEQVTIVSVDDACDVDQAIAAAKQLVAAKVNLVIGHLCSRTSIAASEVYDAAGIVMISPASTNPSVTERGLPGVFRTIGRDDDQAAVAATFIMKNFQDRSVALLHDGNTYGKGLVEGVKAELNAAGKSEVLLSAFEADKESYANSIQEIIAAGADVVYAVSNAVNDAALLTRQLKEKLPNATMISADAMAGDGFSLIAGDSAEGTYFTFGPDQRRAPLAQEVVARFRDEEAYEPEGYTLYSYAAVQAWAGAVEKAGSEASDDVISALRSGKFSTVIGDIGFDSKGDVTGVSNFVMYVWGAEDYAEVN